MIYKTLTNPSNKDITDYRISEQMHNELGEPVMNEEGQPRLTGQTLEWSIKAGETLEFPAYVADYLVLIYPFLEVTGAKNEPPMKDEEPIVGETTVVAKPTVGSVNCPKCGMHFKNTRALGLHYGSRHPEALL